jgi:hypothetical protein
MANYNTVQFASGICRSGLHHSPRHRESESDSEVRWTYSADLPAGAYVRSEFQVQVTNWRSLANRLYSVAGPGSQRFEDDSSAMVYGGSWTLPRGNYSGGTIHYTQAQGSSVR